MSYPQDNTCPSLAILTTTSAPVGTKLYVTAEDAEYVAVPTADKASNAIASGVACISWQFSGGIVTIGATKYAVKSLSLGNTATVTSGIATLEERGIGTNVGIGTTDPTTVLAVVLSGLTADSMYHAILKTSVALWDYTVPATCGSMDFNTDLFIETSSAGVATVTLTGTAATDVTRLPAGLSTAVSTVAASTGGFTISATIPAEMTCVARGTWSLSMLTKLTHS